LRLFFALWPPPEAAQALAGWTREVQRDAGGRATGQDNIHLTLAFLGEADPDLAAAAARRVRNASFELSIDTSRYWRHNQIVWVGPASMPDPLDALVRQLHGFLADAAFTLEKRAFAAHVTLLRKAAQPRSLPALPRADWPAREFLLMGSVPGGNKYRAIAAFPLDD
jgi:2'-5' RNA ligase